MGNKIVCRNCKSELSERDLVTKSFVEESCPRCRNTISTEERFRSENVAARIAGDVAAVDAWLAAECNSENACVVRPVRDRESDGEFRWAITGMLPDSCPGNWSADVLHETDTPGVLEVRITKPQAAERLDAEFVHRLAVVAARHGLQPHGIRGESSQWGVRHLLHTSPLTTGLLSPVVARLLAAMREAASMAE